VEMKKLVFVVAVFAGISFLVIPENAFGQSDIARYEVGGQFTLRNIPLQDDVYEICCKLDKGVGGRFSFNLNKQFALESEVNFFTKDTRRTPSVGKTQMLFGIKAGGRNEKIGGFVKIRPGIMRFSSISDCPTTESTSCGLHSKNEFTLDAGGVVEFYPSQKTVIRFDAGNTLIKFSPTYLMQFGSRFRSTDGRTQNYFQVSIGAGFRF
jgi:hypothetical protein